MHRCFLASGLRRGDIFVHLKRPALVSAGISDPYCSLCFAVFQISVVFSAL